MENDVLFLEVIGDEFRRALPAHVAVVTSLASTSREIPDTERQLVSRAVDKRQAEFVAGRWCAHRALEEIGRPAEIIGIGPQGAPLWPAGATGSITHDSGLCVAVAARLANVNALGIDLVNTRHEIDAAGFV